MQWEPEILQEKQQQQKNVKVFFMLHLKAHSPVGNINFWTTFEDRNIYGLVVGIKQSSLLYSCISNTLSANFVLEM